MQSDRSLIDHIFDDVLHKLDGLKARAMFGGFGLYLNGKIFGIFDDGIMYLKVDEETRQEFEKRGSEPFSYPKKDGTKAYMKKYWSTPEELYDDPDELKLWVEKAASII